mgnify:CR=1 FL=1
MTHSTFELSSNRINQLIGSLSLCAAFLAPCAIAQGTENQNAIMSLANESKFETVAALVNTNWEQPGHFGYLHIDANNVSGEDGCNMYSGTDFQGDSAGFFFTASGEIKSGAHWHLLTTLRACFPPRLPAIELPSKYWSTYQLDGNTLTITLNDGQQIQLIKKD